MPVIEIFDTDEDQAMYGEVVEAPKARKPRSRKTQTSKTDGATPKAVDDAPKKQAKPAAKRRTSKAAGDQPDLAPPAADDGAVAEKPKRTRSRSKKAESESGTVASAAGDDKLTAEAAGATGATEATGAAGAAEATSTTEAAGAAEAAGATGAAGAGQDESEAKPRRTRRGGRKSKEAAPDTDAPQTPQAEPAESLQKSAPVEQPLSARQLDGESSAQPESSAPAQSPSSAPAPVLSLTEFSPVASALALPRSILPALDAPRSLEDNVNGNTAEGVGAENAGNGADPENAGDGAEGAPTASKSRSRSARRRKAAARKRAEALAELQGLRPEAPDAETSRPETFDEQGTRSEIDEAETVAPMALRALDEEADAFGDFADEARHARAYGTALDADDDDGSASGTATGTAEAAAEGSDPGADTTAAPKKSRRSRGRGRNKNKNAEKPEVDDATADDARMDDDADFDDDMDDDAPKEPRVKTNRKMLVSVLPGELVEVVVLDEGKVQEYYVEMEHHAKIRGNIYKGIVSNIDVNLQAAFVNYGNVKNGFLQIDEVHPEYWLTHHDATKGHKYPPIQKVMKPGQEVLVQVVKEPNGAKGAFLTTWVSLAGRFLVLTPGQEQIGISRKVEDGEERNRLRELIKGLNPGEGLGAIVRTVSAGTSKTTLQKDLSFLKRVWKDIRKRAGTEKAPCLIYKEPSLATRAVRDYLSDDISEVWVDNADTAEAIRDMTTLLFPRKADLLHLYTDGTKTLWEHFKARKALDQIHSREVTLPSGGRLVFDQTEALMAIDINSGKSGGKTNFESMALRTNMEAAEMIAHQLRLRDVGGQVVIDFIEMRDQNHCREVEKTMRNAMKGDRARYDIGKMSSFGLLQIVRQRIGSSAISISQEPCPHCDGTGLRRNMEWQSLQILRDLKVQLRNAAASGLTELVTPLESELAVYLLNHKRERLCALEKEHGVRLEIKIAL